MLLKPMVDLADTTDNFPMICGKLRSISVNSRCHAQRHTMRPTRIPIRVELLPGRPLEFRLRGLLYGALLALDEFMAEGRQIAAFFLSSLGNEKHVLMVVPPAGALFNDCHTVFATDVVNPCGRNHRNSVTISNVGDRLGFK